jgi:hypothetical protein
VLWLRHKDLGFWDHCGESQRTHSILRSARVRPQSWSSSIPKPSPHHPDTTPPTMYLSTFLPLATLLPSILAVHIFFFDDPKDCIGIGVACLDVANGTCCYTPRVEGKRQFWSVRGSAGRPTDQIRVYAGDLTESCTNAFGAAAVYRYDQCLRSLDTASWYANSIAGARWNYEGVEFGIGAAGAEAEAGCEAGVVADKMVSDGKQTWVISKEKLGGVMAGGMEMPSEKADVVEFFKTHADTVLDHEGDAELQHVALAAPQNLLSVLQNRPPMLRRDNEQDLTKRGKCDCRWIKPEGPGSESVEYCPCRNKNSPFPPRSVLALGPDFVEKRLGKGCVCCQGTRQQMCEECGCSSKGSRRARQDDTIVYIPGIH